MKQKKIVNILIIVATSSLLLLVWFRGPDLWYAKLLSLGANLALMPWSGTGISVVLQDGSPVFIVHTLFDGQPGTFPQDGELFLMPFIMIVTWQILLFFNIPNRRAIRSTIEKVLIFYIIQVIFLLLLTSYYRSEFSRFMFALLLDSFYILALFLIIKDTIRYRLIGLTRE